MPIHAPPLNVKEADGSPNVIAVRIIQVEPGTLTVIGAGDVTVDTSAGSIADILDLSTAETDTALVLGPDGAGGVEWQAEVGGAASDGFTYIIKSADQDVTNAQNQDDTELQFSTSSTKHYIVEGYLLTSGSDAAGDFQWRLAVGAGTADGRGVYVGHDTALAYDSGQLTWVASGNSSSQSQGTNAAADTGVPGVVRFWMAFRQNSSGATFKVQFGNAATGVGRVSRMMRGSYIRYRQTD